MIKTNLLLNLVLHSRHSVLLWQQNLVSGAAKVTQHVVSLVVQQDVLNLERKAATGPHGWLCAASLTGRRLLDPNDALAVRPMSTVLQKENSNRRLVSKVQTWRQLIISIYYCSNSDVNI